MSYSKTKLGRRKVKYQNILMKNLNITVSDSPTKILAVCNGGLVNGLNQESIYKVFCEYGELKDIFMVPNKSYSFLSFKDLDNAIEAYNKLNGQMIWPQINGSIYLIYINELPKKITSLDFSTKPNGLIILEEFIIPAEENSILACIDFEAENVNCGELKHRKVKHYGYEFKYSTNGVDLNDPIEKIPSEFNFLWDRLSHLPYDIDTDFDLNFKPDQLTVNRYNPGQGIPPHVDTHSAFEDGILSLSLQSDTVMEFKNNNGKTCCVVLPRRSLCIMSGEARYGWTHAITPRKSDVVPSCSGGLTLKQRSIRTSLTFRKTKNGDCNCSFTNFCDTAKKQTVPRVKSDVLEGHVAAKLEENYVHEVYEKIASHFSETRHKPWPNVVKFCQSFQIGSFLVDVGCGNGKYLGLDSDKFLTGCDCSFGLMQVCRQRGFECFACNCLNLPIRDDVADGCISIAVIHHLATEERRKKAISEMIRILKQGGRGLIYVWAKNQERQNKKSSYLKQANPKTRVEEKKSECVRLESVKDEILLPVHTNRTNFDHNDLLVPWKLKEGSKLVNETKPNTFLRYYHVFEDNELRDLCLTFENVKVEDYYYDQGNWCIILLKT